ncbi:SDR family oxidoreductase shroud [Arctopsyche grandis]|uniref:SDR family oxidoreductase shroud n=1 Tax=Arctopsyche grandis TaxID=121162 RepID=UPI00406D8294
MLRPKSLFPSKEMVVLVSGCDSGLGFQTALTASKAGLTVVAGMFEGPTTEAAADLKRLCPSQHQPHLLHLDITDDASVTNAVKYVSDIIESNSNYYLHAVINNAGVMVFGNLEWQTQRQIDTQVGVNLLGTLRLSRETLPLLRRSSRINAKKNIKPRLITVGSHCGIQPLPTLSVYAATKCAIKGWCEAIRMELKPLGVEVVNFIPGSLVASTAIAEKQKQHFEEMKGSMNSERWSVYGEYFEKISNHLSTLSFSKPADSVKDNVLMEKMMAAILDQEPDPSYLHQPWRYAFYHTLCRITPTKIRQWLVGKFMRMPKFTSTRNTDSFCMGKGARQGDTISPKLLNAVLKGIFRNLEWETARVSINSHFLSHLWFADDKVLIARDPADLLNIPIQLDRKNRIKNDLNKTNLMFNGCCIEPYGQIIDKSASQNEEIERRLKLEWSFDWLWLWLRL